MTLSNTLNQNKDMLEANKFALEILNRLRVVEAECAYYKYQKPLYKLYRPASSNSLLTLVDALVDLIHNTYLADLQNKSKNQLKNIFNGMFPHKNINEIKMAMTAYVDDCSIKIANLNQTNVCLDQLELIEKILIQCFPRINQSYLSKILIQISELGKPVAPTPKESENTLDVTTSSSAQQPENLVENDDYVDVKIEVERSRFFSKDRGNADLIHEEKQVCTIS